MSSYSPIPIPSEIEQLAHDILAGTVKPDETLYPARHWRSAAADCVDGNPVDLEAYLAETDDWHNGLWTDETVTYVPRSLELPCSALQGGFR